MFRSIIFLFFIFITGICNAQITLDTNVTANILAQKLLGQGVTVFNAKLVSASNQCAVFTSTNNALPLKSGVVLTTGVAKTTNATSRNGVDKFPLINFPNNKRFTAGDTDLTNFYNLVTYDACVLEFDFIPEADSIKVRYIFGSEEYPSENCTSYNDVFAFFISGFGYNGLKNIALVPGTPLPVTINTINSGVLGFLADSSYCYLGYGSPFTNLYYDNSLSNYLSYNGRTTVLTARAAVKCGSVYHIKIVIADAADRQKDSGVFLEAGSISSPKTASIYTNNFYKTNDTLALVERCHPQAKLSLVRGALTPKNTPFAVNLSCSGTAIYGIDYLPIDTVVNFAANQDTVAININIIDDGVGDDNENIIIKLKSQSAICSSPISTDSIFIKIKEHWTNSSRIDTAICANRLAILKSSYADSVVNSFLWDDGKTSAFDTLSIGKHWVNALFKNTCTQSDTFNINKVNFDVFTSLNDSICQGDSIKISYTSTQPITSILWNTGSGDSIITIKSSGNYILTATNSLGCIAKDTTIITIKFQPQINLPNNLNVCIGDSILLDATSTNANSYIWNNGKTNSSIWVSQSSKYSVAVTGNSGCISYDTTIVTALDLPMINLPNAKSICRGDSVLLDATTANANIYLWSNGITTKTIWVKQNGLFTVQVIGTNGCKNRDTTDVVILELPQINLPTTASFCAGDSLKLDATTNSANSYLWSNGNTNSFIWAKQSGNFIVKIIGVNSCINFDTIAILKKAIPQSNLPKHISFCKKESADLDAANSQVIDYLWNNGTKSAKIKIFSDGIYKVKLTSANGCISYDSTDVTTFDLPTVNAGNDILSLADKTILFDAIASANATKFLWLPIDNLSNANLLKPTLKAKNSQQYIITVFTINNCTAADTINVNVITTLVVPNVFSPNNDGINDTWDIPILLAYPKATVEVFDRYGRKVFTSLGYKKPWNGISIINGNPLPVGTYYYVFNTNVEFKNETFSGTITIIR